MVRLLIWEHGGVKGLLARLRAGLSLAGFLAVSGAVIAFGTVGFIPALIITIGGLLKGAAYAIGWSIYPQGTGKKAFLG